MIYLTLAIIPATAFLAFSIWLLVNAIKIDKEYDRKFKGQRGDL